MDASGYRVRFLIAYQERPQSPVNRALLALFPEFNFQAEVLVMRAGRRALVVGIRGVEMRRLAAEALHK